MAVFTKDLVFVHVAKTAGMATTDALLRNCFPSWSTQEPHCPLGLLTKEQLGDRMVFSNVRNPWSWYRSWYRHVLRWEENHDMLLAYGNGELDFESVLYGVTHPKHAKRPPALGGFWPPPDFDEFEVLQMTGSGLYSYACHYMWDGRIDVFVASDRIREGLSELLGQKVDVHSINLNMGPEVPLYNEDMVQWVADADGELIERFSFVFGQSSSWSVFGV